ncbi:Maf family protein [Arcticibacterium luteifluviistationis]|uniref:dTTP/UTP pyrophosphatase n=1 Tax=Arcticibacterium luteifluviistationis TaxID=1784714 RepID=A0A2Z4GHS2_9BACT|nr:Maf family protein [Arcticibacterium luteifluviistationis]AWW00506.1 septum formation protein Maf [Arcticibacterium luteifluviistationis]
MIKLSKHLILGSGSPRRKEILQNAGFEFDVETKPTSEEFDPSQMPEEIPVFLAKQKLAEFGEEYADKIVLCADTVVVLDGEILNKPANESEATEMLKALSGKKHEVITGVAFKTGNVIESFYDTCLVDFEELSDSEIEYYIKTCMPFDKAGAYGIQDFIGMIGVKSLKGSFYTVMGLPIHLVYGKLKRFIVWPTVAD